MCGFIWPKTLDFYVKNIRIFIRNKNWSLKVTVPEFQKYKINNFQF